MAPWRPPLPRPARCCATCAPAGRAAGPSWWRSTGASRNTVSARVDQLIAANLLEEGGRGWSTGGRPPTLLRFNSRAGCVLAVDLGVTSVDVAVTDLSAQILATAGHPIDIADGPGPVLAEVDRLAQQVLAEAGLTPADVCAVGVGVPGSGRVLDRPALAPADHARLARLPHPQRLRPLRVPGLRRQRRERHGARRDRASPAPPQDVLVVKVGTGIGCGVIVDGRVYRGAQGSAGDIGHIYVAQPDGRTVHLPVRQRELPRGDRRRRRAAPRRPWRPGCR